MLTSTSSHNGFGEALTSQPRSTSSSSSFRTATNSSNNPCGNSGSGGGGMDLSYVTERIISLWFPSSTSLHSYRQGQRQAAHMLQNKHGDNYMVSFAIKYTFNVEECRYGSFTGYIWYKMNSC